MDMINIAGCHRRVPFARVRQREDWAAGAEQRIVRSSVLNVKSGNVIVAA